MTDKELRDLDAEVHRRVMGRECRWVEDRDDEGNEWLGNFSANREWVNLDYMDAETNLRMPRYSTDIAAAWLVVEALRGREAMLDLTGPFDVQSGEEWRADIRLAEYGYVVQSGSATERTAPLAVCRAALAAVSSPEEPTR